MHALLDNLARIPVAVRDRIRNLTPQARRARSGQPWHGGEEGLSEALGSVLDGFAIYTAVRDRQGAIADFRVVYANDVAAVIAGSLPEDLIGTNLSETMWDYQASGLFNEHVRVVETGLAHAWTDLPVRLSGGEPETRFFDGLAAKHGDGFVITWRDVTDRKRRETKLEELASHDSLTGILNRRAFYSEMQRQVARWRRHGSVATLMLLDVDNLKGVNDAFGHDAGDLLLQLTASTLEDRLRTTDTVGRIGGDEFAVLLSETDAEAAEQVAQEVVAALRRRWFKVEDQRVTASASVGVARLEDVEDVQELMQKADEALYRAKRAGGGKVALPAAHS